MLGEEQTFYLLNGLKYKGVVVSANPVLGVPAIQITDKYGGVQDVFVHALSTRTAKENKRDENYGNV